MAIETREEWIEYAKRVYDSQMEHKRISMQLQADYGKWIIASLLLTHGGAMVLLGKGDAMSQSILTVAFPWHACGVLFILLAAGITWINWSCHWAAMEKYSPKMIFDENDWNVETPWLDRIINLTMWLSVVAVSASFVCLGGAARAASKLF